MNIPPWVKFPYQDHPKSNVKALAKFEQLNPYQTYTVPCNRICAMHKAVGFIPGGAVVLGGNVNTADMLPMPTAGG